MGTRSKYAHSNPTTRPTSSQPSTARAPSHSTVGLFTPKRSFTQEEVAYFLNPDFVNHVALVAVVDEGGRRVIVGGGRYIVVKPGKAEIAFAVVDEYQGQRIGAALMRHLAVIAREAGLEELVAEVLSDNISMLKLFERSGLRLGTARDAGVVHVTLALESAVNG